MRKPLLCQCGCDKPATMVVAWRSPSMAAPAFWYLTDDCAAKAIAGFSDSVTFSQRPMDVPVQA